MLLVGPAKSMFFKNMSKEERFRAGSTYGPYKWPGGIVRYYAPPEPEFNSRVIETALSELSQVTNYCVRFERISQPSGDYVHLYNAGRGICHGYVGRIGGPQKLSLGEGCWGKDTIQHEFMHALGFYHEHSRPDRDQHIKVVWEAVSTHACNQFAICRGCQTYTPYNVYSIMHYESTGFPCDWNKPNTMLIRSNNGLIPRNKAIAQTDITMIKKHYGCP